MVQGVLSIRAEVRFRAISKPSPIGTWELVRKRSVARGGLPEHQMQGITVVGGPKRHTSSVVTSRGVWNVASSMMKTLE